MQMFTSWFFVYVTILLLYNVSPSVSFVITARNTVKSKSFKIGISTSLGVATANCLFAVIGFLFCYTLNKNKVMFQYYQILGMSYLLYTGIKMLTTKIETNFTKNTQLISIKTFEAYKDGFFYTSSSISIAITIISLISQFYHYIDRWYLHLIFLFCVPCISFLSSIIVVCCYFLKLSWLYSKYATLIDKIVGFVIILLATTNVKSILG